jgi:hypothetical protein
MISFNQRMNSSMKKEEGGGDGDARVFLFFAILGQRRRYLILPINLPTHLIIGLNGHCINIFNIKFHFFFIPYEWKYKLSRQKNSAK